jgi:hypothetical protein
VEINRNVDFRVQIDTLTAALPEWPPGNAKDPVQRVRNLLYAAAVPDLLEMEILESYVPLVVFDRLRQIFWIRVRIRHRRSTFLT